VRYRSFQLAGVTFHGVGLDVSRVDLQIADARTGNREVAEVNELVAATHALAGVNGTFFDDNHRPVGWLVSGGVQLNPIHDTPWFAALVLREDAGHRWLEILPTEAIRALSPAGRQSVRFAIQVGPRTVVEGEPLKLKSQSAERTAACIVSPTELVLIATEGAAVDANWLAWLMARPEAQGGFGCQSGLMFDGGPSTQLSLRTPSLNDDVPGGWPVPNAVVAVPRLTLGAPRLQEQR